MTIEIKISNEKERFTIHVMLSSIVVGVLIFTSLLGPSSIDFLLVMFGISLLIVLVMLIIMEKLASIFGSWDYPTVYRITDYEVWRAQHYEEGDNFAKYKLASIKKLVLKNRRTKWIELWFKDNKDRPLEIFSAPFFENCNEEWQQLFEEIRKRIPPDAEVIVK